MFKAIKEYLYLRKYFKQLVKDNLRMRDQLEEANEVAMFYGKMQDQAVLMPVTIYNFNKASNYCYKYSLPMRLQLPQEKK